MRELSIFVDESGDFGPYSYHSPYYLFTLVLHNQEHPVSEQISVLDRKIQEHGFVNHAIHTGPIIRNEGFYQRYTFEERKRIFNDLLFFTRSVDIKYHTLTIEKKHIDSKNVLIQRLSKQLKVFLNEHYSYFSSFDKIIIYYDYGQSEITTILTSVFSVLFDNVEFRHVQPFQYKLFQVADLICTLELSKLNFDNSRETKSERSFYVNKSKFKDFYYKAIKKKQI